ncbi:MAG: TRAM domain-containing protein [Phycisphaeraceae bacterium]|nr:TRAM domain-containing protein [Phycisphaeraceae bacterium]
MRMILAILRGVFLLLAASVAMLYLLTYQEQGAVRMGNLILMAIAMLGVASLIVAGDILTPRKKLSALSGVFLGLLGGLVAAYALSLVVDFIGLVAAPERGDERQAFLNLLEGVKIFIGLIACYAGISVVLQTKDDFRFVIPYVEFAKQIRGTRPTVLDTSILIDGRILDLIGSNILQGSLIVPQFILTELQAVADSADKLKRARGRRGLEVLQKLQSNGRVEVALDNSDAEGATVDQKLVSLAQQLQARVMTNDFNLAKIADVRGVEVINLNELAKAMRPVALPGETLTVTVVKPGEGPGQGVGYLEDGTMVVIEEARSAIGKPVDIQVTSSIQTSAGRMIFGRRADAPGSAASSSPRPSTT